MVSSARHILTVLTLTPCYAHKCLYTLYALAGKEQILPGTLGGPYRQNFQIGKSVPVRRCFHFVGCGSLGVFIVSNHIPMWTGRGVQAQHGEQ